MKRLYPLAVLIITMSLTGCFQILHYLNLNENGTIDVYWQFDMSKKLAEMDKKKGGPDSKKGKKESIDTKIDKKRKELPEKLKPYVTNLVTKETKDEFLMGFVVSFTAKKYLDKQLKDEEFAFLPVFDKKKKALVFNFKSKPKPKKKKGADGGGEKKDAMGMGKIINAVMSSARYQIILGSTYKPVKAEVVVKKTGKKMKVTVQKLGSQYIISIPFMSILMEDEGIEEEGFDLLVYME